MQNSFQTRSESENRGPLIVIINGTVTGVAAAVVALRLVSRAAIVKRLGLDDWTMAAATVTAILNVVIAGLGKHDGTVPSTNLVPAAKLRYVTHIVYTLITGLIKASICLLYLRLFPNLRGLTRGTIAFITAMTTAIILATIFQCSPVDAVYNPHKYHHYLCFASIPFWYATAALSLVTDLWILILPVRTILGLQVGKKKRLMVVGLLSLGSFACIASIVRMVYIVKLYQSTDPSWSTFGVSVSSGIEVAVSIIAASLPGTKPVIDLIFPRLFSTTANKSHTPSQGLYANRMSHTAHRSHRQHDEISLVHLTTKEGDPGESDSTTTVSHA
ncbi:hypothetical protein BO94DRAFT_613767 [Aspergillus sclerotioniger CBS 115572]|uniref:Rhodopsin domain-containing protein n=1 Tax=Aspergillus sclerotioniger CBS 115572 TaxID=1450535 RepID=A0A317V165_9EURO|nr:hypothetical protein BO94DRAFT_613767 [Aspergillus sclerotioniger CBS 115572]PWY66522.1 hypothetical protein BO94DRAFT_613767 [Aspergillus sclerotioniger CBS 115572]